MLTSSFKRSISRALKIIGETAFAIADGPIADVGADHALQAVWDDRDALAGTYQANRDLQFAHLENFLWHQHAVPEGGQHLVSEAWPRLLRKYDQQVVHLVRHLQRYCFAGEPMPAGQGDNQWLLAHIIRSKFVKKTK